MRMLSLGMKFLFTLYLAKFLDFEALGFYGLFFASSMMGRTFTCLSMPYTISRRAITLSLAITCRDIRYYVSYLGVVYGFFSILAVGYGVIEGHLVFVCLILGVAALEHILNDAYSLMMSLQRPVIANLMHAFRTSLWMMSFIAVSFFIVDMRNVEVIFSFWLSGSFLAFLLFCFVTRSWPWRQRHMRVPLRRWVKRKFRKSKTNYGVDCLKTMSSHIDQFIISLLLGLSFAGVYTYFMQLYTAMLNLMQTGVLQIYKPKMVVAYKKGDNFIGLYKQALLRTLLIALCLSSVSGLVYAYVTVLLDKQLVLEWIYILIPLMVIFLMNMFYETNINVFYSAHRDDLILKCLLLTLPISIALKISLIPVLSLWGTVCALMIEALVGCYISRKRVHALFNKLKKNTL